MTLCISHTTTPSVIPQGKHVTEYQSEWSPISIDNDGFLIKLPGLKINVNDSCHTIDNLQGNYAVFFSANVHPGHDMSVQRSEVSQYPFNAFSTNEDHHDIAIIFYVTTEGMHEGFYLHVCTYVHVYCG